MSPASPKIRPEFAVSMLIFMGILFIYGQVLGFDFVNYDDPKYVTENPRVLSGLTWEGVAWAFGSIHDGNWFPLTWLSLMIDSTLYGGQAWGFHLTNVIGHVINSLLLFFLFRTMTGGLWQSAFVAALFALHPLHVESVAWISERKDVLSTFWGLLGLVAYVFYCRRPSRIRYGLVFLCLFLGLMSKSMLVTFPFVLLLLDFWPLDRMGREGSDGGAYLSVDRLGLLIWEKLPLFAMAAVFSAVTFWAQKTGGGVSSLDLYPMGVRVANALVALATYLGFVLWPARLAVFYPHPGTTLAFGHVVFAGSLLAMITVSACILRRRAPYFIVGWLWFLGTLIPVVGLVQVGGQAMADRYMYIPLIGIGIVLAWGGTDLAGRLRVHRSIVILGALFLLSMWSFQAHRQAGYWKNGITLFEHALDVTDKNFVAHMNLGNALLAAGRTETAVFHLKQAVAIRPHEPSAHFNLGGALTEMGARKRAMDSYREALRRDPNYPGAHGNLANLLTLEGNYTEARAHYLEEMAITPESAGTVGNLANLLALMGEFDQAAIHYERAIAMDPSDPATHWNFGKVLNAMGNLPEAAQHVMDAIRLDPENAAAYLDASRIYRQLGKHDLADAYYRQAAAIDSTLVPGVTTR